MMLFIDKEQKTVDEVAAMFKVDFSKVEKAPEFEINEAKKGVSKHGQSKEMSIPAGTRFPAVFTANWNGKGIEIRYAQTIHEEQVGDKMVPKYYPLKVMFTGESYLVDGADRALALYFYLFPLNETSPFRKQLKGPHSYSFKDMSAKGEIRMGRFSELTKALNFINGLSGDKLKVYAKGMGISGVEVSEERTIQADLADLASKNPVEFNNKIETNHTMFKGVILNGIDSGMFRLDESRGQKVWKWGQGVHNQEDIISMPTNASVPVQVLLDHIMGNINVFFEKMISAQATIQSEKKANTFLEEQTFDMDAFFAGGGTASKPVADPAELIGGNSKETSSEGEPDGSVTLTAEEELAQLDQKHRELFGTPKPPTIRLDNLRNKIQAEESRRASQA